MYQNYKTGMEAWVSMQKVFPGDGAFNHCMRYLEARLVHTISDDEIRFCRELYAAINNHEIEERSANFVRHGELMGNFSITNIVKAYDYIKLLSQFIPKENEVLDDMDNALSPLLEVIRELQLSKECPHCAAGLFMSDLPQYDSVCVECDENF
jgi:hypothetical protein